MLANQPFMVKREVQIHIGAILTIMLLVGLGLMLGSWNDPGSEHFFYYFLQAGSGIVLILLPPIYFTWYWLIPKYLTEKHYLPFAVGMLLLIVCWGYVAEHMELWIDVHWFNDEPKPAEPGQAMIAIAFIMVLSTSVHLSYQWFTQLSRMKQMENDQLHLELSVLKNQISPHFFFNTLNNLYALALEQSEETPNVILKLSEMMRYTIYDCKAPLVGLGNEVKYLENYIALQQIRYHGQKHILFHHDIKGSGLKIAPMVLVVFLENAFKHGVEVMLDKAFVSIDLSTEGNTLTFNIENNHNNAAFKKGEGGLGLENVKRRLSLIYEDAHTLHIKKEDSLFSVALTIEL